MSAALLPIVALILVVGIASRVVADWLQIPSVLFLIISGIAIGPEGLDIVGRDVFGNGLPALVGVSVSIILFEGAFRLDTDRLREAPMDIVRLVTLGAVVMWLGTAATVRFVLEIDGGLVGWDVALLVGALLIATGPTVITPILNVVTVRDHVSAAMESEGIINDVTAAVLAVVVFEVLILESESAVIFLADFVFRISVGIAAGLLAASALWYLFDKVGLQPGNALLHARLLVLASIVGTFAIAELIAAESGIAAAATMGFVIGNTDLPHKAEIEAFIENLTTIVLAFVFVKLAVLINFGDIRTLGYAGIFVVVGVTLVVRPLLIFASIHNERFTLNERLFMSSVAPRGIIPASVATLYALELRDVGAVEEAQLLAGIVFLIIFVTVVFQGGLAKQIGKRLDVIPMRTIIVGGGRVGRALARRLEQDGESVVVVETDDDEIEKARDLGLQVVHGDGTEAADLEDAGAENVKSIIATTADDDVNLLVCQLANTKFDAEIVASRVNQSDNVEAFEALDVRAIDSGLATATSLENVIERPSLTSWMNELGRSGDVQEIAVTAEDLVGKTIADVHAEIPDGCIVGLVTHDGGRTHAPSGDHTLEEGEKMTFIGQREAVNRAVKRFHPHN